jgi:hypothetical protein
MMIRVDNNKLVNYGKLFILLIGAALLSIGFVGLAYDYAGDLVIRAGNTGWVFIGAGVALMVLSLAGYVLIPMIREHSRLKQLSDYYKQKYPNKAELDSLIHDIR